MTSPLMLVIPVMLPPGLARLATSPVATGSKVATNTTGIRPAAASLAGSTDGVPEAMMISTPRRANSVAAPGICAALCAKPYSITKCRPSTSPSSRSPCWNPPMNDAGGGPTRKKPMRLIFPCLLRPRHHRPRRRAAEQRYEIAPFHCRCLRYSNGKDSTPQPRQETAALRDFNSAYVGSGSWSCKNPRGLRYRRFIDGRSRPLFGSDYALIAAISG
jgi:hypothetical protein